MNAKISQFGVKSLVWAFNKIMGNALQGLHVDTNSITKLQNLLKEGKRIVLMPVYRSFADMFIFVFVHHHFGLPMPFMVGSNEDAP